MRTDPLLDIDKLVEPRKVDLMELMGQMLDEVELRVQRDVFMAFRVYIPQGVAGTPLLLPSFSHVPIHSNP